MKEYNQDEYLLLSGIQHFAFCRRQWALIHIESAWSENYHTTIGNIFHEKVHDNRIIEKRKNVISSRAIPIHSKTLGISGECDIVEFRLDEKGVKVQGRNGNYIPYPIEYKKGSPKTDNIDILQLVAQVICLEEMFCCNIEYGYLFYGKTKHREKIIITTELKEIVFNTFDEMHSIYNRGYIPKVKTSKKCQTCSLIDICLPKLCEEKSAKRYIENNINGEINNEKII